jgi:hypothetical protein
VGAAKLLAEHEKAVRVVTRLTRALDVVADKGLLPGRNEG